MIMWILIGVVIVILFSVLTTNNSTQRKLKEMENSINYEIAQIKNSPVYHSSNLKYETIVLLKDTNKIISKGEFAGTVPVIPYIGQTLSFDCPDGHFDSKVVEINQYLRQGTGGQTIFIYVEDFKPSTLPVDLKKFL